MSGAAEGYNALSGMYDVFNSHVDYAAWADFAEKCFSRFLPSRPELVLDLACGTGRLTALLADRGYDMIGVDASDGMLIRARETCPDSVLLLCQDMCGFELYGTVGAVVCSLDSLNHLTRPKSLEKCFALVHNYLDPDGLFLFDVNSLWRFEREYASNSFCYDDVTEDGRAVFCSWQNDYRPSSGICRFTVDVFTETEPESGKYVRDCEDWSEKYYSREALSELLEQTGFELLGVWGSEKLRPCRSGDRKMYFCARAKK